VRARLGTAIYGREDESLEAVVGEMLSERGWTVATAESCTAGMLSARLANVAGSSAWLRGGVASYATDVKSSLLRVPAALLDEPVSEAVAAAMASGVRDVMGADVGLSVTCSAGPDPQGDAPVGLTYLGLSMPGAEVVREVRIPGDREQIRLFATTFSLNLLRLNLLG
jgi:nicotinamide-nucleotide amidase